MCKNPHSCSSDKLINLRMPRLTRSSPAVASLASMVQLKLNAGAAWRTRAQRTPVSAVLPGPGGAVPPGHVNDTDGVTCQCPGPCTAVRAETGQMRRRCCGRAVLVAYWLILHRTTPPVLTSHPVFKSAFCVHVDISTFM